MKNIIFKYPLQHADVQTVTMPVGAKVLCVQIQYSTQGSPDLDFMVPTLWAMVDTNAATLEERLFHVIGTGHIIKAELAPRLRYVGTYQLAHGALVFHVFEEVAA